MDPFQLGDGGQKNEHTKFAVCWGMLPQDPCFCSDQTSISVAPKQTQVVQVTANQFAWLQRLRQLSVWCHCCLSGSNTLCLLYHTSLIMLHYFHCHNWGSILYSGATLDQLVVYEPKGWDFWVHPAEFLATCRTVPPKKRFCHLINLLLYSMTYPHCTKLHCSYCLAILKNQWPFPVCVPSPVSENLAAVPLLLVLSWTE